VVRNRIAGLLTRGDNAENRKGENNAEYRMRAIILPDGSKVKEDPVSRFRMVRATWIFLGDQRSHERVGFRLLHFHLRPAIRRVFPRQLELEVVVGEAFGVGAVEDI
jgi:hypothetical protein